MDRLNVTEELGRRDFIRSATLAGSAVGVSALVAACAESGEQPLISLSQDSDSGVTWHQTDSFDDDTGIFRSVSRISGGSTTTSDEDIHLNGYEILPSGQIVPYSHTIHVDEHMNSFSLAPVSEGFYRIFSNGVAQPAGAPLLLRLVERNIPGTNVKVVSGYSIDPNGKRVRFTATTYQPASPTSGQVFWLSIAIWAVRILLFYLVSTAHAPGPHDQGGGG